MRRSFIITVALTLALTLLFSCTNVNNETDTSRPSDPSPTPTDTETTASALSEYVFVCASTLDPVVIDAVNLVTQEINEKFDLLLPVQADTFKGLDGNIEYYDHEILIGDTNRQESQAAISEVRFFDYGYRIEGGKAMILAHSPDLLRSAVELFAADLMAYPEGPDSFLSTNVYRLVEGEYSIDSVTVNGNELRNYRIVYSQGGDSGEQTMAKELSITLSLLTGYRITAISDNDCEADGNAREILIGNTNRSTKLPDGLGANRGYIGYHDGAIQIYGADENGLYTAVEHFKGMLSENKAGNKITVDGFSEKRLTSDIEPLRLMSYNIQIGYRSSFRDEQVIEMIKKYDPDVLGLQEASLDWIETIIEACPEYAYVGKSRDGNVGGEYNPILYKKDKFTLVKTETKWLSDTPDRVSRFPESGMNRITTIVQLQRNSDQKVFTYANTHLQHDDGAARRKQSEVLVDLLKTYSEYPIFISGDMNAVYQEPAITNIVKGGYTDSSSVAKRSEYSVTTSGKWGISGALIDYIFVTSDLITVLRYDVCTEPIKGSDPSDHHPLYVDVIFK